MTEPIRFRWHKSSHSGETNGCLEIRTPPQAGRTRIRDSKNPSGPALSYPTHSWNAFVQAVCRGEFGSGVLDELDHR